MSNDTLALLARCKSVVARLLEDEARLDRAVFFTTCGDDDDEQYSLMLNMHRPLLEYVRADLIWATPPIASGLPDVDIDRVEADAVVMSIARMLAVADDELKNMLEVKE